MAEEVARQADAQASKRARRLRVLVLACCGGLTVGCDSGAFLPPRPAELGVHDATGTGNVAGAAGAVAGPSSPSARTVEIIAGPLEGMDSEAVLSVARIEAGLDAVLVDVKVAGKDGNPSAASAVVESAGARKPLALVLFFLDEKEPALAKAIADARGKGVPVIVIAGSKAGAESAETKGVRGKDARASTSGRLIHVVPEPVNDAVQSMVAAAVRNARNAGLKPENGAILMVNTASDPLVEERAQAFRDAFKSAGISAIEEIHFAGDLNLAQKKMVDLMRNNLKPVIVVSADHIGLTASFQAMNQLGDERPYIVAGFTHEESGGNMTKMGEFAAVAVFSPERLLRKAVSVAAALGRGETVHDRVEILVPALLSPENSKTATMYKRQNQRKSELNSR